MHGSSSPMTVPLLLIALVFVVATVTPRALTRTTWSRRSPRMGIVAWQASAVSILTACVLLATFAVLPVERMRFDLGHLLHACPEVLRLGFSFMGPGSPHLASLFVAGITVMLLLQLRIERQAVEVDGEGARITEPKAGSCRTVNLPTPAVDALRAHLQGLPSGLPSAPLFTRPDGSELRAHHVHYAWKMARLQAGLPDAHFHDLRHAGLTLSAQAGATLAEVMRRAGHNSVAAALRYQHAADQRDVDVAARLSALADQRTRAQRNDGGSSRRGGTQG